MITSKHYYHACHRFFCEPHRTAGQSLGAIRAHMCNTSASPRGRPNKNFPL